MHFFPSSALKVVATGKLNIEEPSREPRGQKRTIICTSFCAASPEIYCRYQEVHCRELAKRRRYRNCQRIEVLRNSTARENWEDSFCRVLSDLGFILLLLRFEALFLVTELECYTRTHDCAPSAGLRFQSWPQPLFYDKASKNQFASPGVQHFKPQRVLNGSQDAFSR